MDNESQGERDPRNQELEPEASEQGFETNDYIFDGNRGIDWEAWWQIIVHRNENVQEAAPPEYPDEAWSLDDKEAPFPFNLGETRYCAAALVVILLVHSELDTGWLSQRGYTNYLVRVVFRVSLTVTISFLSTLAFEVVGNILDQARGAIIYGVSLRTRALFAEYLGWGPVDDDGRADWVNEVPFHQDATYLHEPIAEIASGISVLTIHYMFMILFPILRLAVGFGITWLVGLASGSLAEFIMRLPLYFALPIPETDVSFDVGALLWEYGISSFIQVWAATFLYLTVFLFMSRAETPIIMGRGGQDPFSKLIFQLLRATAMHLLAYTAYQITCGCIIVFSAFPCEFDMCNLYDSLLGYASIWRNSIELSPGAGVWIMVTHLLIKNMCRCFVMISWQFWVPYIVWLSIKTEESTQQNWMVYRSLLDNDMDVLDLGKRVVSRAGMTTVFGLRSSWPARIRLSTGDNID
ncbi:hypothetical protein F5Y11DRAFT_365617 [Daldinia sp. FL1419]|nr:hypothetical protein F5Y11DRAFT_365617 [Daldinia sp. FL1419]